MREIYDPVRKRWVRATPEEIVRQTLLRQMIDRLGYPKELIAVEKDLKEMPHLKNSSPPKRRIDLVCFAKGLSKEHPLYPLILIECKDTPLDRKAIEQVIGYHYFVDSPFIAVANAEEVWVGCKAKYIFQRTLPSYADLLKQVELCQ